LKSFCDPGLANTCNAKPIICPTAPKRVVTTWKINMMVSNHTNSAAHTDLTLENPWGIVLFNNQFWLANNMGPSMGNYDLFGNRILGPIMVGDSTHNSSHPTGIAVNCGGGFPVSNGTISKSAQLILATEHGTVHAYNPAVDSIRTFVVLNQQLTGEVAVYRGVAIAGNVLYLADFYWRHIDVFNSNWIRLNGFHFVDDCASDPIPLDFGPNNIVHIGCHLYILYARQDAMIPLQDLDGPGHGYISVFNLDGSFVRRFASRGVLNSPWAMIPAPCECGFPPGSFLVGNNGDGRINIFDCDGRYVGPLLGQSGLPVMIEGLWGLAPHYTNFNEIFFTAAPNEDLDGNFGSMTRDQKISF